MKSLFIQLLSLSILIASFPLLPSNAFAIGCDSQEHYDKKKACDENPALEWDSDRCDCLDKKNNDEYNQKFNECTENEDYDGKEKQYCYSRNGLDAAGMSQCGALFDTSKEDGGNVEKSDAKVMNKCMDSMGYSRALESWTSNLALMNGVLGIIMWIVYSNQPKDTQMCWSTKIMTAASVVGLANELINYFFHEQELRQLQVDYYDKALCDTTLSNDSNSLSSDTSSDNETDTSLGCSNKSPYDTQAEAFEFLISERRVSKNVYLKKGIGYTIAATLFLLAGVSALVQITGTFGTGTVASCYISDNEPPKQNPTLFDSFVQKIVSGLIAKYVIKEAHADNSDYSSNIMNGSISGWGHFFKTEHYRCELKPEGKGSGTYQTTIEDYNKCMECMRAQTNKELSSNDESETTISGCSKYERKLEEQPTFWALLSGAGVGVVAAGFAAVESAKGTINGFGKMLIGQLILALASGVLSIIQAVVMYSSFAEANEQQKALEGVQEEFLGAIALRCPNGREDQNDPPCYCFNQDGSRRDDRSNSETCQNIYADLDRKFDLESGDLFLGQKTTQLGCVAIDGSPDPDCNCQKFKDAKTGRNACYQVPMSTGQLGNIMTGTGADQAVTSANTVTGSNQGGTINSAGSLLNSAKNLVDVSKKLLKNLNNKLQSKGKQPLDIGSNKIAAVVQSISTPKLRSIAKNFQTSKTSSPHANKVLKRAKKKIKKVKATFSGGKGLAFNNAAKKKNGLGFDFESSSSGGKTKNFMNKKYKYKKDDVVKNSGASIWKVITNRYNNSAYNRLFEE